MNAIPKRIQLSRRKGWSMPPNTVKVDRSTKWGNPFKIGEKYRVVDWGACTNCSRSLLAAKGPPHGGGGIAIVTITAALSVELYEEYLDRFPLDVSDLRGKNLACWCPLNAPCHADVLLEIANREAAS